MSPLFASTGDEHIDAVLTAAIAVTRKYAAPGDLDRIRDAVRAWEAECPHADRWPPRYER